MVYDAPQNQNAVFFAAWVELIDDEGKKYEYRIVGPDEIDIDKGYISINSPMARALLKKQLDDEIEVKTPEGSRYYEITAIRYES